MKELIIDVKDAYKICKDIEEDRIVSYLVNNFIKEGCDLISVIIKCGKVIIFVDKEKVGMYPSWTFILNITNFQWERIDLSKKYSNIRYISSKTIKA